MLYGILLGIDVLVAIALIVLVLLHRGKGAEAGAVFSGGGTGGGSNTVFGAYGPQSFLSRMVAVLAAVFLINSLVLAYLANRDFTTRSVLDEAGVEAGAPASTSTETVDGMPAEDADAESMEAMDEMEKMEDADAMDELDDGPPTDDGSMGNTDPQY